MSESSESFAHGEHNERVCDLLALQDPPFPDWVITTAFYASLHFVTSKIFPISYPVKDSPNITFRNIAEWQRFKNYSSNKRHELIKNLVGEHCSVIASEYEWLLSSSMNSRYHSYSHPPEIVNKARDYMKKIKRYCSV
jgi:hypothetical protein